MGTRFVDNLKKRINLLGCFFSAVSLSVYKWPHVLSLTKMKIGNGYSSIYKSLHEEPVKSHR